MIVDNPARYTVQTLPVSDRGTEMRRRIFFIGKQRLTADQRLTRESGKAPAQGTQKGPARVLFILSAGV